MAMSALIIVSVALIIVSMLCMLVVGSLFVDCFAMMG
jgi:hypothetical protein